MKMVNLFWALLPVWISCIGAGSATSPVLDSRCPIVRGKRAVSGPCAQHCDSNYDCTGGKICCSNGCGTQCRDPPQDPRCPWPSGYAIPTCPRSTCSTNEDCDVDYICCDDGCSRKCTPIPGYDERCDKSLLIEPLIRGRRPEKEFLCSANSDCIGGYMCCPGWFGSGCYRKPETCPPGVLPAPCAPRACENARCPKHPYAPCSHYTCGGCRTDFHNFDHVLLKDCYE